MQSKTPGPHSITREKSAEEIRRDARRYVDSLAMRLGEIDRLAGLALQFNVYEADRYANFKRLFLSFSDLAEEFQMLSQLTEEALARFRRVGTHHWVEHKDLEENFRRLQVPMLHQVISTNLHLLRVWDDRLQSGEGLPYGANELFVETIRVIHRARMQLLRPRYLAMLDERALHEADRADRLLRVLIERSPKLFDFGGDDDDFLRLLYEEPDTADPRLLDGLDQPDPPAAS